MALTASKAKEIVLDVHIARGSTEVDAFRAAAALERDMVVHRGDRTPRDPNIITAVDVCNTTNRGASAGACIEHWASLCSTPNRVHTDAVGMFACDRV